MKRWRLWNTDEFDFRGRHLSYQRSRHITHPGTSLIKIEGVDDVKGAKYVETPRTETKNSPSRCTNVAFLFAASTSASVLLSSTVARRRSAAARSASSGARSPALTVFIPPFLYYGPRNGHGESKKPVQRC